MKILSKIIIVIVIIIAIPLVLALFISKDYHVTKTVVIDKPREQVFNYIKNLKNQDHYSVWVMMDPNMKKKFTGTDGTPGFIYAWDGNKKAGQGEQEITKIKQGERIDVEVRFVRPMVEKAWCPMTTTTEPGDQTKVTWEMKGKSSYPCNFMNLFMDEMLGKDMDKSLNTLKGILEKQ